jgi:hypothetical protein
MKMAPALLTTKKKTRRKKTMRKFNTGDRVKLIHTDNDSIDLEAGIKLGDLGTVDKLRYANSAPRINWDRTNNSSFVADYQIRKVLPVDFIGQEIKTFNSMQPCYFTDFKELPAKEVSPSLMNHYLRTPWIWWR